MKRSDEQLIDDYIEGNEKAVNLLVDRYLTDVYNFALSLTKDRQASEDITQDSFIKAWKKASCIRGFVAAIRSTLCRSASPVKY